MSAGFVPATGWQVSCPSGRVCSHGALHATRPLSTGLDYRDAPSDKGINVIPPARFELDPQVRGPRPGFALAWCASGLSCRGEIRAEGPRFELGCRSLDRLFSGQRRLASPASFLNFQAQCIGGGHRTPNLRFWRPPRCPLRHAYALGPT